MIDRAQQLMNAVWDVRNTGGADTENKLTAAILRLAADSIMHYNAQNNILVLDKNDLLNLSNELEQL